MTEHEFADRLVIEIAQEMYRSLGVTGIQNDGQRGTAVQKIVRDSFDLAERMIEARRAYQTANPEHRPLPTR